ncbi:uncharacterized protein lipib isoform X2 [Scophthalmus maximus]|uniref:uncharacterized protein lipib isoform X2 n=1 Tax=Scophthalmus maximus TaxID=52904 RepID=UPI001FA8CBAB|nr:uncharacterized protein lipib isoform X2 [Scophthalmus maximus]
MLARVVLHSFSSTAVRSHVDARALSQPLRKDSGRRLKAPEVMRAPSLSLSVRLFASSIPSVPLWSEVKDAAPQTSGSAGTLRALRRPGGERRGRALRQLHRPQPVALPHGNQPVRAAAALHPLQPRLWPRGRPPPPILAAAVQPVPPHRLRHPRLPAHRGAAHLDRPRGAPAGRAGRHERHRGGLEQGCGEPQLLHRRDLHEGGRPQPDGLHHDDGGGRSVSELRAPPGRQSGSSPGRIRGRKPEGKDRTHHRSGPGRSDVHQRHAGPEAGPLGRHVCGRSSHRHELIRTERSSRPHRLLCQRRSRPTGVSQNHFCSDFLDGRCLQCEAFKPSPCPVLGYDVGQWRDTLLRLGQTKVFFSTTATLPYRKLSYRVDMVTWNQYLRWGVVYIRLHSGRDVTEARIDHKLYRLEQYTSTRLLAQFDEDLPQVQKISLRINTGNVIGPRYKIRLLRIRFTPLGRPERPLMCRFDVIMEENMEVAFRPLSCDSRL